MQFIGRGINKENGEINNLLHKHFNCLTSSPPCKYSEMFESVFVMKMN